MIKKIWDLLFPALNSLPQVNKVTDLPEPVKYITWKKGELKHLAPHVLSSEVECKRCSINDPQKISVELLEKFEKIRKDFGKPIRITSGYRCLLHNRAIGSSDTSQHVTGDALDLQPMIFNKLQDLERLYIICEHYFDAIGDARYRNKDRLLANFVHVDTRSDRKRRWTY